MFGAGRDVIRVDNLGKRSPGYIADRIAKLPFESGGYENEYSLTINRENDIK